MIDTLDYDFDDEGEETPMINVTPPQPAEDVAPEAAPAPEPEPQPERRMPLPSVVKKRKPWEREQEKKKKPGPRLPPHSVEGEEQLLSACLLDGDDVIRRCVTQGVTPASFYVPANALIFEKVLKLHAQGMPIDAYVVSEELKTAGQLDEIGGYPYLTRISGKVPTTAGATYSIDKVKEMERLRTLIMAATKTVEGCYNYTGPEDMPEVIAPLNVVFEEHGSMAERLFKSRIHHEKAPKEAKTMLSIAGKPVSTQGNLTAIIAQAKAGKTTFIGGAITAICAADGLAKQGADTLGWHAVPTDGRIILYFDTELSPHDHWTMIDRAGRRAGCKMPSNFWNFCLTGWNAADIKRGVRSAIEMLVRQKKEIYAVFLDGVADLCQDVNDSAESNALVAELHGLAIYATAPIVCVMHRNEGDKADSAARGHLGKQLARKAETNLRLEQKEGVSYVFADRNRGAPILADEGPAFKWSVHSLMHVSVSQEEKAQFHRDNAPADKKPRAKREPRESAEPKAPKEERKRWSQSEVVALFPFSVSKAVALPQIARRAETELMMPARVFGEYRHNLLFEGVIHKTGDGLYYREL